MSQQHDLRIDGHKLIFHPRRVVQWLDGTLTSPVYMEISLTGSCNHRCTFCAKDYLGYVPRSLDTTILTQRISELGSLGVAGIMYGGEGEPLVHSDAARIVEHTRAAGIDAAMSTNGVLLVPGLAEQILPRMQWIKVSVNAGTAKTYAAIHRTRPEDFQTVFANIEAAARLIRTNGWACTLGTQSLLLPENAEEMELLAERSRDAGAHYLVIKPYSQHHKSTTRSYAELDYAPYLEMQERLERFNDGRFQVIFRRNTILKTLGQERGYERCLALPFWSYVDAGGNVWGCSSYIGDERFRYGNLQEETFREIWTGQRRRALLDFAARELNAEACRRNCRMDEINRYLWELTHPSGHVNFI